MKKNILVVGFGSMGCRHAQALLTNKAEFDVHILEPLQENITNNLARIGAVITDCKWYSSIDEIKDVDLAIVATSSGPRYSIVKALLEKGIKYFLLEKIVFQSKQQFNEILATVEKNKAVVYCNFVNRYFPVYNEIHDLISKNNYVTDVTIYGNAFGLGCNAIHYVDLFQYLTGDNEVKILNSGLEQLNSENRRGSEYKEFVGVIKIQNTKKENLTIISEKDFTGGIVITIKCNNNTFILSEQTQRYFKISDNEIKSEIFIMMPTSKLSNIIVKEILNNTCSLTTLKDTYKAHVELIENFNNALYNNNTETLLCPIT